jgi:hypothetical protein
VTNAYTESANGLAKDYEQGGPRLCVRRHPCRVLYGPDPVDPTEFVQCEHCGIRFAAGMLVSQVRAARTDRELSCASMRVIDR